MRTWLIDGSGYIYRSFYTLPTMTKSDGTHVGAIFGYCEMLHKLMEAPDCTHMAVVLDGGRSGRDQIDVNYKANRKPRPPELTSQVKMLPEVNAAHSLPSIKQDGFEADDVIATYAEQISTAGHECVIYSSDKDLLPLLTLEGVSIYDPLKKQWITPKICVERFGVTPEQMTDYLSIVGDSSDNIPGIPKVGAKSAAKLLQDHFDLETILQIAETRPDLLSCPPAQRSSVVQNGKMAMKSRELVKLQTIVGLPEIDPWEGFDAASLHGWLTSMEFALLARKIDEQFGLGVAA